MRKVFATMLAVMLALSLSMCYADSEHPTDDYAWLDDMTIKQLKELDVEIYSIICFLRLLMSNHMASIMPLRTSRKQSPRCEIG